MNSTLVAARPLLRRTLQQPLRNTVARRCESSASQTAQKTAEATKNAAADYKAKAAEGLSRVTSAAGPAIAGAAKNVSNALGKVGGRTGRLIAFVERQVPFVTYYGKVGLELSKMVFRGQKMDPPSVATFQNYFNRAVNLIKNPSTLASGTNAVPSIQQLRNLNRAQLVGGGVLLAELLGFFTVGEIVGRFKLIGYHGEVAHHH